MTTKLINDLKKEIGRREQELNALVDAANLLLSTSTKKGRKQSLKSAVSSIIAGAESAGGKGSKKAKKTGRRGRPPGSKNKPGAKKPGPKGNKSASKASAPAKKATAAKSKATGAKRGRKPGRPKGTTKVQVPTSVESSNS
jgi:hypothetical protein